MVLSLADSSNDILKGLETKTKISVVIPALNEEEGIAGTIAAIPVAELAMMGYDAEILVVDNGSTDRTAELAREAGATVVTEPRRGYGRAYKTGFAHARGEIIATADADLTYPVEDVPRLINMLEEENLDFITTNRFGSMEEKSMPFRNKIGNAILALETKVLFGCRMRDPESGMWVFRRDILDRIQLESDSWPFSHEIKLEACHFAKCRWSEVPIQYRVRAGDTNLATGWRVGFADLVHILKMRFALRNMPKASLRSALVRAFGVLGLK